MADQKNNGFWRTLWRTLAKNPVSTFAVVLVAAMAWFLGYMIVWQTNILTNAGWCRQAVWAGQLPENMTTQQTLEIVKSCNNLLLVQVEAIAADSHIDHSVVGLVLVVLIVVVVAGARLAFKVSQQGLEGNIGKEIGDAADEVAKAADDKATEIKEEVKDAPPSP